MLSYFSRIYTSTSNVGRRYYLFPYVIIVMKDKWRQSIKLMIGKAYHTELSII